MQHRTALQSSMGIGEKPAQGEMFAEFRGDDGYKAPLTKPPTKERPELLNSPHFQMCTEAR